MGEELKYGGGVVVPFMRQAAKNKVPLVNESYGRVGSITSIDGGVLLVLPTNEGLVADAFFLRDSTAKANGVFPATVGMGLFYTIAPIDNDLGVLLSIREIVTCMPARSAAITPPPRP